MPSPTPITIVNVGYRSTNYWVVSAGASRLLVDRGYPGTMGMMRANLKRMGVPFKELRYALAIRRAAGRRSACPSARASVSRSPPTGAGEGRGWTNREAVPARRTGLH
jgi:hypothetical protein